MPTLSPPRSRTAVSWGCSRYRRLESTVVRWATVSGRSPRCSSSVISRCPRSDPWPRCRRPRRGPCRARRARRSRRRRPRRSAPRRAARPPAHPHGAPPESVRRHEVLRRVVGHVGAAVTGQPHLALELLEGRRVRLAPARPERLGEHDQVGPPAEQQRLGLGLLAGERTVGDHRQRHVRGQAVEPVPGVGQQLDRGGVRPVHLDQARDQVVGHLDPRSGQRLVEDRAAHAGLERGPRPVAEVVDPQLVARPRTHGREPAAHVVALEVQGVVDVEDDEPSPAGRVSLGHAGASASSTNTAAS